MNLCQFCRQKHATHQVIDGDGHTALACESCAKHLKKSGAMFMPAPKV